MKKNIEKNYYFENRDLQHEYYEKYYNENQDNIKKFRSDNKDKRNDYFRKRRKIDLIFKLAYKLRTRISHVSKAQNVRKVNKTFNLLGCSHTFLKRCLTYELYGDMTLENYGKIWCLDHCLPIASFKLLDGKQMRKCFSWIIIRPLYSSENNSKKDEVINSLYLLHEIKANYFEKLN